MSRAPLVSLTAAAACIVAPVTVLAGVHSPVRVAAALLLFCLAPGAALLPLLTARRPDAELGLVIALSLAVCAVAAQSMLWLGMWSPVTGTCVAAGACLLPIALQLARMRFER
jgi:CHASE2 domain-containing sensor protein